MRIIDTQGRLTIWPAGVVLAGQLQFTGANHPGIQLNNLSSAQRDALAGNFGMLLYNTDENALNQYSLDIDAVSNGWLGVPKHSIEDCGRVYMSRLPNVATAITLVSNTAYFVFMGRTTKPVKIRHVEFYVNTAGSGTQTAEVGLFGSSVAPNRAVPSPTITKLTATPAGGVDALNATGVKRNTSALNIGQGYVVAAGTYLWAGIRTAMATSQPAIAGLCMDFNDGLVVSAAAAGDLNAGSSWTGALIGMGTYMNTAIAPDLRLTLDT